MKTRIDAILLSTTAMLMALAFTFGAQAQEDDGSVLCDDTCPSANDGECDDGGAGSVFALCPLGTDCGDCGPRSAE